MKRRGKSTSTEAFQKALGANIEKQILKKGYKSAYDFWIQEAEDSISRATLNFILVGKTDPKITTLREIARLLELKTSDLLDFE